MDHPYKGLPARAFWRGGVSGVSPLELSEIYSPRFRIDENIRIAAAGSCFAQHISRELKARSFNFLDAERPPSIMSPSDHARFGFNLFSARYGNVYSARQLVQLIERALGRLAPREEFWVTDGRYFDPYRPSVEPNGFSSEDELRKDVAYHLSRVRHLLGETELFIFTFGLTEAWVSRDDGMVFPMCPGTAAGEFDSARYAFHNFRYEEVLEDAEAFIALGLAHNPRMKFLFTVSPVPLVATASGQHVLTATTYSKSVLRAVCGAICDKYPQADYFPSYELIASHPMRAILFQPDLRGVAQAGVSHVMSAFFDAHDAAPLSASMRDSISLPHADDEACDEVILDTFRK